MVTSILTSIENSLKDLSSNEVYQEVVCKIPLPPNLTSFLGSDPFNEVDKKNNNPLFVARRLYNDKKIIRFEVEHHCKYCDIISYSNILIVYFSCSG